MCEAHAIVITYFEIYTLITKSTEPCAKSKLGYFSKMDVDIDSGAAGTKLKNSKFLWKLTNRVFEETIIFGMTLPDFPEKIRHLGLLYFDSHCTSLKRGMSKSFSSCSFLHSIRVAKVH